MRGRRADGAAPASLDHTNREDRIIMADKTIVALYDDYSDAQQAVRDLESAGFARDDISIVANDVDSQYSRAGASDADRTDADRVTGDGKLGSEGAGTGATIGTVIGGGAGLLAGIGLLAIPGVGPVVAAGPIVATITGAGVGAAAGGLLGGLVGMGVPEEHAQAYAEGVRRGGALVTVRLDDGRVDAATGMLERHRPTDVDERSAAWRQSGWSRFDEKADPYDAADIHRERGRFSGGDTLAAMTGAESSPPPVGAATVSGRGDTPSIAAGTSEATRGGAPGSTDLAAPMPTGDMAPTASAAPQTGADIAGTQAPGARTDTVSEGGIGATAPVGGVTPERGMGVSPGSDSGDSSVGLGDTRSLGADTGRAGLGDRESAGGGMPGNAGMTAHTTPAAVRGLGRVRSYPGGGQDYVTGIDRAAAGNKPYTSTESGAGGTGMEPGSGSGLGNAGGVAGDVDPASPAEGDPTKSRSDRMP
jgi:hypothetical protein